MKDSDRILSTLNTRLNSNLPGNLLLLSFLFVRFGQHLELLEIQVRHKRRGAGTTPLPLSAHAHNWKTPTMAPLAIYQESTMVVNETGQGPSHTALSAL